MKPHVGLTFGCNTKSLDRGLDWKRLTSGEQKSFKLQMECLRSFAITLHYKVFIPNC